MGKIEDLLQDKILKFLAEKHIWHFRYPASTTWGIPDVIALYKSKLIGIEIKREDGKGKATLLQLVTVKSIQDNGGLAAIVDNLNCVIDLIEDLSENRQVKPFWVNSN